MKHNIIKISGLILGLFLVFTACETEESLNITSPNPGFVLQEPGISNIFLNSTLSENPAFTISWNDEVTGATSYNVEMATETEFLSPISIGTSATNSFTMNVSNFNSELVNAGISSFSNSPVYMRVLAGGETSNVVTFIVNSYPENNPIIDSPENNFALTLLEDSVDSNALTIEWTDPDFSDLTTVPVMYTVQSALAGTNFDSPVTLGFGTDIYSLDQTHGELNSTALNTGLAPEVEGSMEIRIMATFETTSGSVERFSDPITILVTPFQNISEASWGVVGSGYNDWGGAGLDGTFYTTSTANVIVAYVALVTGEIKFRENNDWGNNIGDNGLDGTLEPNGANIPVTIAGRYKIEINLNDNTYTMEPFTWGIVGGAYNNWGATPDAAFSYDYTTDTFKVGVKLIDGEMKFRFNNDWGVNFGDDGGDGTLDAGGANIAVTAGFYKFTLDLVNNTYMYQTGDVWGIIGSAYNDWGATPDFTLTEVNPGVWIAEGVDFIPGEMKFRINEDWGVNMGDDGADGTLDDGGANIVITEAGKYRIVLDTNLGTYTLNKVQ